MDSSSGTIAWPDAHHSCCVLVTCATPLPHRPHIRACIQDGLAFGQLALRQVSACVLAGRSDTRLLAFWWTNAVHLRGFLQSLSLAMAQATGETGTNDEAPKHWAAEVSTPPACCHNRPPPPTPPPSHTSLALLPPAPPSRPFSLTTTSPHLTHKHNNKVCQHEVDLRQSSPSHK